MRICVLCPKLHAPVLTTTYASVTYSLFNVSSLSLSGVERLNGLESLRRLVSGTALSLSRTRSRNSEVRGTAGILLKQGVQSSESDVSVVGVCVTSYIYHTQADPWAGTLTPVVHARSRLVSRHVGGLRPSTKTRALCVVLQQMPTTRMPYASPRRSYRGRGLSAVGERAVLV